MEWNIDLQWKNTKSDGGLELWVNETGEWTHYKKAKYYYRDIVVSSNSGFATFQNYIKLSKQNIFKLNIIPTNPE